MDIDSPKPRKMGNHEKEVTLYLSVSEGYLLTVVIGKNYQGTMKIIQ